MVIGTGDEIMDNGSAESGDIFHKCKILIVEKNNKGAIGFILNKPSGRNLNELAQYADCPPIPIWHGGPVDEAHLFFLHRLNELGGDRIMEHLYYGGDFATAVKWLLSGKLADDSLTLFIGYCGWEGGQLERETSNGDWIITSKKQD